MWQLGKGKDRTEGKTIIIQSTSVPVGEATLSRCHLRNRKRFARNATEVNPIKVEEKGDTLLYTYNVMKGEKQTYSIQPVSIIIIDKKYENKELVLSEDGIWNLLADYRDIQKKNK